MAKVYEQVNGLARSRSDHGLTSAEAEHLDRVGLARAGLQCSLELAGKLEPKEVARGQALLIRATYKQFTAGEYFYGANFLFGVNDAVDRFGLDGH